MQTIRIAKLSNHAKLPTRKHPEDAGLDIYANGDHTIPALNHAIIPSGITVEVPKGYVALLKPKGRNDHLLGAGVVDAGYQGEILVKVFNPTNQPLVISHGDAIGQMLLLPVVTPAVEEAEIYQIHQAKSERGQTGGIVEQHQV
ncbi:MAG: hypothetical protein CL609_10130 [Anaerolineaceae bacterium]|nr:hypothetical protein [Anaerolineaceae bacterium]